MIEFLKDQGVDKELLDRVVKYREKYKLDKEIKNRIPKIQYLYRGKEVWEMAISAILNGNNILLTGLKATGKNVLAENLAYLFSRPQWTVSLHGASDHDSLIGADTFKDGQVVYRRGSIYQCALYGGFGVLDEINMAKNDALATLYSILDYRRMIDISGYEKLDIHEATRFIATMNYGYAGSKELNEALVSRFMVIDMPIMTEDILKELLLSNYNNLKNEALISVINLFKDIQKKVLNGEISSRALDIRGLLAALGSIKIGLRPSLAFKMAISAKVFDTYEKEIIDDIIALSVGEEQGACDYF